MSHHSGHEVLLLRNTMDASLVRGQTCEAFYHVFWKVKSLENAKLSGVGMAN